MKKSTRPMAFIISAGVLFLASGCAHAPRGQSTQSPAAQSQAFETQTAQNGEPSVRGDVMSEIPALHAVHFYYDSAILTAETRHILRNNASWLKEHRDVIVQVAGHCDQRGTEEYNLALGQRRANAVRHYYIMLGVRHSRIATISYGKDKPLCDEMVESCWSRNRRAETLGASPAIVKNTNK